MKKVVVNGRFFLHRITGVERYAREILAELDKIVDPGQIEIAVPIDAKGIPKYNNIEVVKVGILHNRIWEHISFPIYIKKRKAISLNLCNVAPLSNPGIVCIHDMKIKAHPEYFSFKFILWYKILFFNEIKRAKKIITVSEFSKREIIKYYHVSPNKIVVIPNSWQHYEKIGFDKKALRKYNLHSGQFYFAMGSMDPNKNFRWIAEMAQKIPTEIFAIAGAINKQVFSEKMGFICPPNVKLLGFISDEEAKTLMKECKAFLFPSFYEGFGIPPLEAISAGCKRIVVSDTDVMHEIFGNSVEYIGNERKIKIISADERKTILEKYEWKSSAKLLYKLLEEEKNLD